MIIHQIKKEIRRIEKVFLRKNLLASLKEEFWMQELLNSQEEITSLGNPLYKNYKKSELFFWIKIPMWLCLDKKTTDMKKCLDIGSAYGTLSVFTKRITDCDIYALDAVELLSQDLVDKYDINYAISNIEKDSFPWEEKFDVIIFTEIFEHLFYNPIAVLEKLKSLLKEDGRLYFSTPDAKEWGRITEPYKNYKEIPYYDSSVVDFPDKGSKKSCNVFQLLKRSLRKNSGHTYQYTKEELLELFDKVGFEVERFDYAPGISSRHFNMTLKIKKSH